MLVFDTPHCYVDTETTGLRDPHYPQGRRVWEIGAIRVDPDGTIHVLHLFIDLRDLALPQLLPDVHRDIRYKLETGLHDITDPTLDHTWYEHLPKTTRAALRVGRFHERHPQRGDGDIGNGRLAREADAAELLRTGPWLRPWQGKQPVLVGMVPDFDATGLRDLLYRHGGDADEKRWDHHLECAQAYAAGRLAWSRPYTADDLCDGLGIPRPSPVVRHTALGDAMLARALKEAVVTTQMTIAPQLVRGARRVPGRM